MSGSPAEESFNSLSFFRRDCSVIPEEPGADVEAVGSQASEAPTKHQQTEGGSRVSGVSNGSLHNMTLYNASSSMPDFGVLEATPIPSDDLASVGLSVLMRPIGGVTGAVQPAICEDEEAVDNLVSGLFQGGSQGFLGPPLAAREYADEVERVVRSITVGSEMPDPVGSYKYDACRFWCDLDVFEQLHYELDRDNAAERAAEDIRGVIRRVMTSGSQCSSSLEDGDIPRMAFLELKAGVHPHPILSNPEVLLDGVGRWNYGAKHLEDFDVERVWSKLDSLYKDGVLDPKLIRSAPCDGILEETDLSKVWVEKIKPWIWSFVGEDKPTDDSSCTLADYEYLLEWIEGFPKLRWTLDDVLFQKKKLLAGPAGGPLCYITLPEALKSRGVVKLDVGAVADGGRAIEGAVVWSITCEGDALTRKMDPYMLSITSDIMRYSLGPKQDYFKTAKRMWSREVHKWIRAISPQEQDEEEPQKTVTPAHLKQISTTLRRLATLFGSSTAALAQAENDIRFVLRILREGQTFSDGSRGEQTQATSNEEVRRGLMQPLPRRIMIHGLSHAANTISDNLIEDDLKATLLDFLASSVAHLVLDVEKDEAREVEEVGTAIGKCEVLKTRLFDSDNLNQMKEMGRMKQGTMEGLLEGVCSVLQQIVQREVHAYLRDQQLLPHILKDVESVLSRAVDAFLKRAGKIPDAQNTCMLLRGSADAPGIQGLKLAGSYSIQGVLRVNSSSITMRCVDSGSKMLNPVSPSDSELHKQLSRSMERRGEAPPVIVKLLLTGSSDLVRCREHQFYILEMLKRIPCVYGLLRCGTTPSGRAFMVFRAECCGGDNEGGISLSTLFEHIQQGNRPPLGLHEARKILHSLLEAVHCIHQHGVVHRALCPSNIRLLGYSNSRLYFPEDERVLCDEQMSTPIKVIGFESAAVWDDVTNYCEIDEESGAVQHLRDLLQDYDFITSRGLFNKSSPNFQHFASLVMPYAAPETLRRWVDLSNKVSPSVLSGKSGRTSSTTAVGPLADLFSCAMIACQLFSGGGSLPPSLSDGRFLAFFRLATSSNSSSQASSFYNTQLLQAVRKYESNGLACRSSCFPEGLFGSIHVLLSCALCPRDKRRFGAPIGSHPARGGAEEVSRNRRLSGPAQPPHLTQTASAATGCIVSPASVCERFQRAMSLSFEKEALQALKGVKSTRESLALPESKRPWGDPWHVLEMWDLRLSSSQLSRLLGNVPNSPLPLLLLRAVPHSAELCQLLIHAGCCPFEFVSGDPLCALQIAIRGGDAKTLKALLEATVEMERFPSLAQTRRDRRKLRANVGRVKPDKLGLTFTSQPKSLFVPERSPLHVRRSSSVSVSSLSTRRLRRPSAMPPGVVPSYETWIQSIGRWIGLVPRAPKKREEKAAEGGEEEKERGEKMVCSIVSVSLPGDENYSALHEVCLYGGGSQKKVVEMVQVLLDLDIDLNKMDRNGYTALDVAGMIKDLPTRVAVWDLLLKNGGQSGRGVCLLSGAFTQNVGGIIVGFLLSLLALFVLVLVEAPVPLLVGGPVGAFFGTVLLAWVLKLVSLRSHYLCIFRATKKAEVKQSIHFVMTQYKKLKEGTREREEEEEV